MRNFKINSLNGKKRSHSILTSVAPFLEGLLENTPVNSIVSRPIVHCNFEPQEPIEIRSINVQGRHYIKARIYGNKSFQEFYLYCHRDNFPKVMDYVVKYCDRKGNKQ